MKRSKTAYIDEQEDDDAMLLGEDYADRISVVRDVAALRSVLQSLR